MNDNLEFSPEVDLWIKRRDLYSQLQSIRERQRAGKRVPLSHFLRGCENNNISRPLSLTDDEIATLLAHSKKRLVELESVAPMLRNEHLNKCLADAVQRRQHKRIRRIKEIIRNEGERRKWGLSDNVLSQNLVALQLKFVLKVQMVSQIAYTKLERMWKNKHPKSFRHASSWLGMLQSVKANCLMILDT
jgi:hypothetical protein